MYPEVARSNGVNARSGHEHSAWPHRRREVQTLPCCGVSSQASQGSKSALDDREHPRDLHGRAQRSWPAAVRAPQASSPTRTGRRMPWRFADWRRIDRRYLNRRIILAAQAHHDPRGQDGHEQQERPAAPSQGHTPRPRACRPSRGRYCAGVEKQSPGVEPSALHVGARIWRTTLTLRAAPTVASVPTVAVATDPLAC